MAHQVLSEDYCSLEKFLRNDLPFSASAHYLVKQLRKWSLTKRMVWVDRWSDYSVVVVSDDQVCRPIPNRLTVTNLKQKHVETVVQEWPYSGIFSDCKEWVSDMIKQNPSVCIENEQRDPVAWILQQDYGCIGMLHVIPEYRRAKLGSAVTMLLMEKLLKEEDYLYSAVNLDNKPSLAFHERNNFEYVSDFSVGFVVYPYEDGLQK
uniref:Glycine N-acyltransferase-like protein n=1 Tax=Magallana gigas TaxID=29159 RepID=K1R0V2_MAGGI